MDFRQAFIAHPQASEPTEPGKGALHDPAMPPQPLAALDLAPRDPRRDPPLAALGPAVRGIVALVGMPFVGPLAGPPQRALDGHHRIQQRLQGQTVRTVGRAQAERERHALAIDQQMVLAPRLAAIRRVRAGNFAPLVAGTSRLSTPARDQSISSAIPSRSSSARCRPSQTPAFCQSRNRRQHVTPLPQPISWGNSAHGMPLRSTNKIPVSVARGGLDGRPPFGFGGSGGSSGSMTLHRSSLTNGLLIPPLLQILRHGFETYTNAQDVLAGLAGADVALVVAA